MSVVAWCKNWVIAVDPDQFRRAKGVVLLYLSSIHPSNSEDKNPISYYYPGFATDCPCGVWCRGLTTCLLYVVPLFGNLVWNDIIAQLKDGAPGKDGILSKGLKCISDHIATPLTRLTNLYFSQGVFPNDLTVALMSPLYKAKDPMTFSNYRPISLLPLFSKILEKLMHNRLLGFLNKYEIIKISLALETTTPHIWLCWSCLKM